MFLGEIFKCNIVRFPLIFCLFQELTTDNEFEKRLLSEVVPPSEIGVSFDDIGALESVKVTLRELVMLPLQRPELFRKGQLTKVNMSPLS